MLVLPMNGPLATLALIALKISITQTKSSGELQGHVDRARRACVQRTEPAAAVVHPRDLRRFRVAIPSAHFAHYKETH